jgi:hypothetical protein
MNLGAAIASKQRRHRASVVKMAVGDDNGFGLDVTDRVLHRRCCLNPVIKQQAIVDEDCTATNLASPAEKLHVH